MRSQVQKWGNSLALRIPKSFAFEAGLRENGVVDLALVDGKLVITPQAEPLSLEALLAGVTADNLPGEQDFGGPAGNEVW
jgi:antitoxin MazE